LQVYIICFAASGVAMNVKWYCKNLKRNAVEPVFYVIPGCNSDSSGYMQNLFPGDSYDTPADSKRDFFDKYIGLGSRWPFYLRNFFVFYQTGKYGRRGELTAERQISQSNKNIRLIEKSGGKVHLRGLNNLSAFEGPAMLIGNHMSLLETAIFHAIARPRRDFTFVIKESLLKMPYFGDIMRSLGAIAVGRANPRDDLKIVMEEGIKTLNSGKSIVLFPQSTRSAEFDPKKFNTIGIKLARRAGVPIIPFALKTDFLANGSFFKDLGPIKREKEVYFEFDKPFTVEGDGKKEHQQIIDFIQLKLAEWKH
jgi:1-acyl-sn-glycerol-3-phosphate acyltransferase